jgi:serine/threonine-protein kinase
MDEELGRRLRAIADVDADAAFARFHAETGSRDPDAFLGYLREQGLISGGAFCALHASAPIRVTALAAPGSAPAAEARPVVPDAVAIAPAAPDAMTVVPAGAAAAASAPPPPPPSPGPGAAAGQYRLLGRIGAGAMGEVYVARDAELGRAVAFKRILPELAGNAVMSARFFAEAQITAQLDHPNVVSIYDLEIGADRSLGYAMKLVEGRTLTKVIDDARRELVARGGGDEPARLTERLRAFLAVCDAIAFAHSKGVLHRDLKPDNIMIGRHGQVYVMDWGICRIIGTPDEEPASVEERVSASAVHGRTRYGAIIGTPAYMSPEQAAGKVPELDGRSDLYALGLILYELIALRRALHTETLEETLASATRGHKAPLGRRVHGVAISRDLAAVVDKATALRPEDRYPDVAAFAGDLRAYLRGDPVTARRDGPIGKATRWIGRHKGATLVAMLALLLAGACAIIVQLVLAQRRVDAAYERARKIELFQLAVAEQGHRLDAEFFRYEEQVARLAGHAAEVLASDERGAAPAYLGGDYDTPGKGPPDLAPAAYYGTPASFLHPVFALAPGVDAAAVDGELGRLVRLRPAFTALMLATAPPDRPRTGTVRDQILDQGVPALRTFVTLASGVHVSYPGTGGYPADYDGRKRPKYTLAEGAAAGDTRIRWGNPFVDRYGHGLVLPASTAVHLPDGTFAGVTGLEMTFDWIADHLLPMRDAPYVAATYLVDGSGDVVIGTDAGFTRADAKAHLASAGDLNQDRAFDLDALRYPEVRAAIAAGSRGHVVVARGGARQLVAVSPLPALGWSYVVVADEDRLLAGGS